MEHKLDAWRPQAEAMIKNCKSSLAAGSLLWWLTQSLEPIKVRRGTQQVLKEINKWKLQVPKVLQDRAMLALTMSLKTQE